MGGLAWERGPLHRLPGGEERPTEGEAGYGDPPSAPDPQPQGRPGINPRVTRGGARHRLSHQQRSSSMNAHARPPLWCRSGAHIHMCAEQHPTLTHISRRSQDVGSFKSVEAQGLDSRPLLSPEGLGTIRALHADASLTDTGANPPQVTHNCAARLAPPSKFGKLSSGHRSGKGQFSFQSQRKANAKECSNYCTITLISHASKIMLKSLQARLQQ